MYILSISTCIPQFERRPRHYVSTWHCQEHGGQNPPDLLLSGWQRDPDISSQVQQEQEFMFPCKNSCFPMGCADAVAEVGRCGSIVYEVNTWLWMFGRGKPRLDGLTIEKTSHMQDSARKSSDKRPKETHERCNGQAILSVY
jgi:hypothetical protein